MTMISIPDAVSITLNKYILCKYVTIMHRHHIKQVYSKINYKHILTEKVLAVSKTRGKPYYTEEPYRRSNIYNAFTIQTEQTILDISLHRFTQQITEVINVGTYTNLIETYKYKLTYFLTVTYIQEVCFLWQTFHLPQKILSFWG